MRLTSQLVALLATLILWFPSAPQPAVHSQDILAAGRKLSAITAVDGAVKGALVAGTHVVFLADYDERGRFDLYSAPLAGGAATRLTADLPAGAIDDFEVSAAGLVVFSIARYPDRQYYLYSVPVTGGTPTLLGPTYPAQPPASEASGGSLLEFGLAGEYVIFRVDAKRNQGFELFSVPAAGGQPILLSQPLPETSRSLYKSAWVISFIISADGTRVAYLRDRTLLEPPYSLFAVPAAGGTAPALLDLSVDPEYVDFAIAPDGSHVVYTATGVLRSVPTSGGPATVMQTGGVPSFAITSDSTRVVYAIWSAASLTMAIKSAPLAGGPAVTVTNNAYKAYAGIFALTPDGTSVLYNDPARTSLLRAPTLGGAPQTIIDADVVPTDVRFTEDAANAVFVTEHTGTFALYSYPLAGGTPTRIDDPALSVGGFLGLEGITPGGRALYVVGASQPSDVRLYSVPIGGGPTVPLSGDLGPKRGAIAVRGMATDGTVIFISGPVTYPQPADWRRIYAVPADGSATARLVDQPRALAGDVLIYAASPTDKRAVYLADQLTDEVRELFSVPLAGGAPIRLNAPGETIRSFQISPSGGRVVYEALPPGQSTVTLFSVPIDGGAATPLGSSLPSGSAEYAITPNGARVLYRATNVSYPDASTLFSAPTAGGAATTIAERVRRFLLDPTSARVVFINDQLRSAPVVGGSVATLAMADDLTSVGLLLITPDGTRVIYEPALTPPQRSLVSQAMTGGTTVTLLSTADLLENFGIQLSADGVYLLHGTQLPVNNQSAPLTYRIQRIPVAGGAALTIKELTLPADSQSVAFSFAQAPGGGPVTYLLTTVSPSTSLLGSVPIDGGQATTIFSSTDPHRVANFTLSADGKQVLFATVFGIYRVPATGFMPPFKLTGPRFVTACGFGGDGVIFIDAGDIFYVPTNGVAKQLERPPDNALALNFAAVGRTIVFTGVRPGSDPAGETVELYATDLPGNSVYLPMLRR